MAVSDIDQVCDDIATFLGAATGITTAQSFDDLSEGVPDLPLLQVYPEEGSTDAFTATDRTTFGGAKRVSETVIVVDHYCRVRSNLDQDMHAVVDGQKNVQAKLETIKNPPFFANSSIKAFRWAWRRATFQPGGDLATYVGLRWTITVRQF